MCFYLLVDVAGLSLPVVGKIMGGFHHTTVLHGVRSMRAAEVEDPHRMAVFIDMARGILKASYLRVGTVPEPKPLRRID
jgi:hypothetical protein